MDSQELKFKTIARTRVKAHCGCSWSWTNYEVTEAMTKANFNGVLLGSVTPQEIFGKADEHHRATNHVVEFRGEIR